LVFRGSRKVGESHYYDENSKEEFAQLFSDTYIGKNPTPLKNSYRILFFEFSGINTDGGMEKIYSGFRDNVKFSIHKYFMSYNYGNHLVELNKIDTPLGLIKYFFGMVADDSIYILIDEYDQFANAILAYSMDDFLTIVGKGGFVRSFYEVLKTATGQGIVQKMFITGVTPITLDSLSSGFNIVSNISNDEQFNEMAGFTQREVEHSLENSIFEVCSNLNQEELLSKIKKWYNGYLFNSKNDNRIYNATLVNYFISKYDYKRCKMPTKMLDSNVVSDYKAIMKLFNIGDSDRNYKILEDLIEKDSIIGSIKDRYDLNQEFTEDDFITIIYSMGFITIKDEITSGVYEFSIPNYVIKMLYFNYFAVQIGVRNNFEISNSIGKILKQLLLGDSKPFEKQLSTVIKTLSNRDHVGFKEKHFQVITLALLSFADFYFIESQPEKNNKYPDILLVGRDEKVPNNYLFELKWLKERDNYAQVKTEGIAQVEGYLKLDSIKNIAKLRSFLLIGSKDGVEFLEL